MSHCGLANSFGTLRHIGYQTSNLVYRTTTRLASRDMTPRSKGQSYKVIKGVQTKYVITQYWTVTSTSYLGHVGGKMTAHLN